MDEREARHRGAEAARLLSEPLFIEAMNGVLAEVRAQLEIVEASNVTEVLRLQGLAAGCRNLELALKAHILAMPTEPEPSATNDHGLN